MIEHLNGGVSTPARVVILGARGTAGGAAERLLKARGAPVLSLGQEELDLLSSDAAQRLRRDLRSDDSLLVISARAPVKDAAMLAENVRMMEHICKALANNGTSPPRLHQFGQAVYADSKLPLTEQSCAEPGSLHGAMHLTRELMLRSVVTAPLAVPAPEPALQRGRPA